MLKNNSGFAVTTVLSTMVQKIPLIDVYFDAWTLFLAFRMALLPLGKKP